MPSDKLNYHYYWTIVGNFRFAEPTQSDLLMNQTKITVDMEGATGCSEQLLTSHAASKYVSVRLFLLGS